MSNRELVASRSIRSRIIVWGINYAPEQTGIGPFNAALCNYLRDVGHDVQMVTSFPYYPGWSKRTTDEGKLFRTDLLEGVTVRRCWHYVPRKVAAWRRIVHEGSFVASSFIRMLFLKRADVYIVVSPPLLLGAAAWFISIIKGAPYMFHVQDLQPDAAVGLGMLKPGMFTRLLYGLEALAYKKASRICGISREMVVSFQRKGVPASKCVYFPNGVVLPEASDNKPDGSFRLKHGIEHEHFLAVYSGNIGVKQGLDVLIRAAAFVNDKRIRIVICGEGADRARLERLLEEACLSNVIMLPLQDTEDYRAMLRDSDICLITQQSGSGQAFLPSKLLNILAFAKPVLAVADDESTLSLAIREGGFGACLPPGSPQGVAEALDALSKDATQLPLLGEAGLAFVKQFEMRKVLGEFAQSIADVLREEATPDEKRQAASPVSSFLL